VNGTGKTTTSGKLAQWNAYPQQNSPVMRGGYIPRSGY
jgi:signal recognition particle GTPase